MNSASKNLMGLHGNFEEMVIHENYLCGITQDEFIGGMDDLVNLFKTIYTGMMNEPQFYMMKNSDDSKGLDKHMNFLFHLIQKGDLNNNNSLEVNGIDLAPALKEAKVTKPEVYFPILESLGFTVTGLSRKIEFSENIIVEYSDSQYLLIVLKVLVGAISMFTKNKPHKQSSIYFELLDHRVLSHYPATEPKTTMAYVLSKLNGESREVVEMFYKFVEPLAKCHIKGSLEHYWTPTFTLKSTKRVIMSFRLTFDRYDIKLNLANLSQYTSLLDHFPMKIIAEIKDNGWECSDEGCNPKCAGAFSFDLDGKSYKKCRGGSFVFHAPDKNEAELLLKLLEAEIEMTS